MLRITKDELLALKPCNPDARLKMFGRRKTMDVAAALAKGASIRDVLWVVSRLGRKDLCIAFALACAVHVEKFDRTGTAKACNDAFAIWIKDPSSDNMSVLRTKRHAAYYAYYAAAAGDADAAYYAYYVYYACDAADAAYYAYDAAAAAYARKHEIAWQKKQLIKLFN